MKCMGTYKVHTVKYRVAKKHRHYMWRALQLSITVAHINIRVFEVLIELERGEGEGELKSLRWGNNEMIHLPPFSHFI